MHYDEEVKKQRLRALALQDDVTKAIRRYNKHAKKHGLEEMQQIALDEVGRTMKENYMSYRELGN